MATERVLRMNGGTGETSYANNSTLQRKVIFKAKPILEESVKRLISCTTPQSCLRVADLGCSSGPNALLVASDILSFIDNASLSLNRQPPVVQIYLNDLFGNDFNTIFKSLPDFYQRMQKEREDKVGTCFINATPGNFYGRLFPNNYIHFFHSTYSLHWLSQAPKELTEGVEPLSKGNTFIKCTSSPAVYKAYFEQFQRDFRLFLKSRSDELKPGGSMVLTFIGREEAKEFSNPSVVFGMVLYDMVLEGLVEEAKLDFFYLPTYGPTAEEVKQLIEAEGSFTLQTLKTFKMGWDANLQEDVDNSFLDNNMRGEFVARYMRAAFEPILETRFGRDIVDELFSRFAIKVANLMELETLEYTNLVMSLTKEP